MIKTIRKFTFEEFLAAISTRNVSFKTLKRVYLGCFCLFLWLRASSFLCCLEQVKIAQKGLNALKIENFGAVWKKDAIKFANLNLNLYLCELLPLARIYTRNA